MELQVGSYRIQRTFRSEPLFSFYEVMSEADNQVYFMRMIAHAAMPTELLNAWYDLYERYQLSITNFKNLPRVRSVENVGPQQVYALLEAKTGQLCSEQSRLTMPQVEQLLDAVWHLHKKGIVHGAIHAENIWLTQDGHVILFGAGEWKALDPYREHSVQLDLRDLAVLLERQVDLDDLQVQRLHQQKANLQTVSDLQDLLGQAVKGGLVEKEMPHQKEPLPELRSVFEEENQPIAEVHSPEAPKQDLTKQTSPDEDIPNREMLIQKTPVQEQPAPNNIIKLNRKKSSTPWIIGGSVALVVLLLGVGGVSYFFGSMHGGKQTASLRQAEANVAPAGKQNKPSATATTSSQTTPKDSAASSQTQTATKTNAPPFSNEDANRLYPAWVVKKEEPLQLGDTHFEIVGLADTVQGQFGGHAKMAVARFDPLAQQWTSAWESRPNPTDADEPIEQILIDHPAGDTALAVATMMSQGNHGASHLVAFTLDATGNCQLQQEEDPGLHKITQDSNSITVDGSFAFGRQRFSLLDGLFHDEKTPRSEMAPPQSVLIGFKLDANGNVVPSQQSEYTVKVGQTVAFVPTDDQTKQAFDADHIEWFSNNESGQPVMSDEVSRMRIGNSETFDHPGEAQILLEGQAQMATLNPPPTFIIHVVGQ